MTTSFKELFVAYADSKHIGFTIKDRDGDEVDISVESTAALFNGIYSLDISNFQAVIDNRHVVDLGGMEHFILEHLHLLQNLRKLALPFWDDPDFDKMITCFPSSLRILSIECVSDIEDVPLVSESSISELHVDYFAEDYLEELCKICPPTLHTFVINELLTEMQGGSREADRIAERLKTLPIKHVFIGNSYLGDGKIIMDQFP